MTTTGYCFNSGRTSLTFHSLLLILNSAQKSDDNVVQELAIEIQKRLPPTVESLEEETTPGTGTTQAKRLHVTIKGIVNKDVNTKGLDKEKVNSKYLRRNLFFCFLSGLVWSRGLIHLLRLVY